MDVRKGLNMNYILIESQTSAGSTAIVTPDTYADRNAAESAFHLKAGAAAISSVEVHSVSMLTEDGKLVRSECYRHAAQVQEEENP